MSSFNQQNQCVRDQYNADQITIHYGATPPPSPSLSLWTVPYLRNPLFTGREEELRLLHEHLSTTQTAALTQAISGLGGIGKTQTALEYVYRYYQDYQAILWVRASSREEIIEDYTTLARLLQLPEQQAQEQQHIVTATRRWLQTNPGWLLVVDNADDLELVKAYLPSSARGHILITTRAQAVKGIADKVELSTMVSEEAIFFLLRRASLLHPDASLEHVSPTDRTTAETIVKELGGLPLALDQAGAYLEETGEGLAGYLSLYRDHRKEVLARRGGIHADHVPVATT